MSFLFCLLAVAQRESRWTIIKNHLRSLFKKKSRNVEFHTQSTPNPYVKGPASTVPGDAKKEKSTVTRKVCLYLNPVLYTDKTVSCIAFLRVFCQPAGNKNLDRNFYM